MTAGVVVVIITIIIIINIIIIIIYNKKSCYTVLVQRFSAATARILSGLLPVVSHVQ